MTPSIPMLSGSTKRYWAIRQCDSLKSPAIFSNWEDCNFYLDARENDVQVDYRRFDDIDGAVAYAFKTTNSQKKAGHDSKETATGDDDQKIVVAAGLVPSEHDILCGRGGLTLHHSGNKSFRVIINKYKNDYIQETENKKKSTYPPLILQDILNSYPKARFLQRISQSEGWYDIGYRKAIAKISQALRENAPMLRGDTPLQTGSPKNNSIDVKRPPSSNEQGSSKKLKSDDEALLTMQFSVCNILPEPSPTHFQGNMEEGKKIDLPEFLHLANYPGIKLGHCTMCGLHRPTKKIPGSKSPSIPTQNKGVCTSCDIRVWVLRKDKTQIKWCKGCKNFRSWATFGVKGHTTKCMSCREYQAERYLQSKKRKEQKNIEKQTSESVAFV